jgi:hypothetical protein
MQQDYVQTIFKASIINLKVVMSTTHLLRLRLRRHSVQMRGSGRLGGGGSADAAGGKAAAGSRRRDRHVVPRLLLQLSAVQVSLHRPDRICGWVIFTHCINWIFWEGAEFKLCGLGKQGKITALNNPNTLDPHGDLNRGSSDLEAATTTSLLHM